MAGTERRRSGVALVHLILFELPVYQQGGLLVHLLCDSVSDRVVRLQPSGKSRTAVLVIHVLLSVSVKKTQRFYVAMPSSLCVCGSCSVSQDKIFVKFAFIKARNVFLGKH